MTAWLLLFLVHSTLWLGGAWLWTRFRPGMHARLRETVWYAAIVASLLTPTAHRAAQQVEDPLAMASCLTQVAGWLLPRDCQQVVPCMARHRSQLAVRVDRLMDEARSHEAPRRARHWLAAAALVALAPWVAPAIAPVEPSVGGLSAIDADVADLAAELRLSSAELGPLAEAPRYRGQLQDIRAQLTRLRTLRQALRSSSVSTDHDTR